MLLGDEKRNCSLSPAMTTERFPHATGRALETDNAHSTENELVLWGSWFCPFVQRVETLTLPSGLFPHTLLGRCG